MRRHAVSGLARRIHRGRARRGGRADERPVHSRPVASGAGAVVGPARPVPRTSQRSRSSWQPSCSVARASASGSCGGASTSPRPRWAAPAACTWATRFLGMPPDGATGTGTARVASKRASFGRSRSRWRSSRAWPTPPASIRRRRTFASPHNRIGAVSPRGPS